MSEGDQNILAKLDYRYCGIICFSLYLLCLFPALPSVGDAADYGALIRQGEFSIRTVHLGYYLFGFPFLKLGQAVGLSTTFSLNLLAALCMAMAVAIANLFYREIGCNDFVSNLASLILGSTGIIWYHAEFGELQALLMFLVITSLIAFSKGYPAVSAVVYSFALLTSQAAATVGLCFVLMAYWRRSWDILVRFGIVFAVTFGMGVLPIAQDYFWGPRGLFPSMGYYQSAPAWKMLIYFCYRLLENQGIWLIPLVVGVISAVKRARHILWLVIAMWIPHAWLNLRLGHIEYGFAWMPFFFLTSLLASLGLQVMWERWRLAPWARLWPSVLMLVGWSLITYQVYILPKRNDAVDLKGLIHATAFETRIGKVIASPYTGFVYVYETIPEKADVWTANWIMWPIGAGEWERITQTDDRLFVLVSKAHTHVFRQWILGSDFLTVLFGAERSRQYLMEGDGTTAEDAAQALPAGWELRLILEQGHSQLYELQKVSTVHKS